MQNDIVKCGLVETGNGAYTDDISIDAYTWYEKNWRHDDYGHIHQRFQLTYVMEGYQYVYIENRQYLVPQHHVIWIPSDRMHKTKSEAATVNLMVVLFKSVPIQDFYTTTHVFPAPAILKEMLLYAAKWSKSTTENQEQAVFLNAMLNSLPYFCNENHYLQIPAPSDTRLIDVTNYINTNYREHIAIELLAELATMSVRSLQRIFKDDTGITVQKYTQLIRILKSVELLDSKKYTLSQIADMVGYKSLSAFTASYFAIIKSKPKAKMKL